MKNLFTLIIAGFLPFAALAENGVEPQESDVAQAEEPTDPMAPMDGTTLNLADFLWVARPIVVFADSPSDPRFRQQLDLLAAQADELADRDVVILVDTDPAAGSSLRTSLRPRGFGLVLIDKDGGVKLRKASPWNVREITRIIDKTPLRQQEVRDRRSVIP